MVQIYLLRSRATAVMIGEKNEMPWAKIDHRRLERGGEERLE